MTEKKYVFIDKQKLKNDPKNAVKLFGNLTKLSHEKVVLKGKITNYNSLYNALGNEKYLDNEDYHIERCETIKSKMKK